MIEPFQVAGVTIEEVDLRALSDNQIAELNAYSNTLNAEAMPEDPPRPVELTAASVRNIPTFVVVREFWARDAAGALAATASAGWTETEDNRHLVESGLNVRSDLRRRGIGTALLRVVADATEEAGRTLLLGGTTTRVPAGEGFAQTLGAEAGLRQHINHLTLADVDRAMVDRWVAEGPGRAEGYSLEKIDGPYPEDMLEEIVEVHKIMNTAPRDDLDMEDWVLTVEQMREFEKSMLATGSQRWSILVRHDESGTLIGNTETSWNPKGNPKIMWQMGTAVRPDHRGHALGKWMKAEMVARILDERAGVTEIRTGNADSNDAMLGINVALGFKPYFATIAWQLQLEKVRAYLGAKV